ncbi:MAG: hypothetical protein AAF202_09830 [Pseudomonadota bacterium]
MKFSAYMPHLDLRDAESDDHYFVTNVLKILVTTNQRKSVKEVGLQLAVLEGFTEILDQQEPSTSRGRSSAEEARALISSLEQIILPPESI